MKQTLILAVESSCDETAVAVVADGKEILSMSLQHRLMYIRNLVVLFQRLQAEFMWKTYLW